MGFYYFFNKKTNSIYVTFSIDLATSINESKTELLGDYLGKNTNSLTLKTHLNLQQDVT